MNRLRIAVWGLALLAMACNEAEDFQGFDGPFRISADFEEHVSRTQLGTPDGNV